MEASSRSGEAGVVRQVNIMLIELVVKTTVGLATLQLSQKGRTFNVIKFEAIDHPELTLAFSPRWYQDLDRKSDMAQCFGFSNCVRYMDVVLGTLQMKANLVEELEYALLQVKVVAFNAEAI